MSEKYQWSLEALYPSFESEALAADFQALQATIKHFERFSIPDTYTAESPETLLVQFIEEENAFAALYSKLSAFANLSQSTEAKNPHAQLWLDKFRKEAAKMTEPRVSLSYWLKDHASEILPLLESHPTLKAHAFAIKERIENASYLLSQSEEALIAMLTQTGSSAWEGLQNKMTALCVIPFEQEDQTKQLPLSAIRNLAYHKDPAIRKAAFEAELSAYPAFIEVSSAALNAIKGEVLTISKLKGYGSPLEMSLQQSRMDQAILDALLGAMKNALPQFRRYLKAKAHYLGHKDALPFYDIFAPVGNSHQQFTVEACMDIVKTAFGGFSKDLENFAQTAFENRWVDFEPRAGKRGGAFCSNIYGIKESRFLCNFQGSMNNIITVAHELGHGYHGQQMFFETAMNASYPMPLAETASTFCETIVKQQLMAHATGEEKLLLLETSIQGYTQIIMDIYSRFLFESAIFEQREEGSLSGDAICKLMEKAQLEAYGDALDPQFTHPYMWMNKVHYYYAQRNFYNFPYAFGLLFAMGLYAKFLEEGPSFVDKYDQMLRLTGKASIYEVGQFMGIDLTQPSFWEASLHLMAQEIDQFINMIG